MYVYCWRKKKQFSWSDCFNYFPKTIKLNETEKPFSDDILYEWTIIHRHIGLYDIIFILDSSTENNDNFIPKTIFWFLHVNEQLSLFIL